MLSSSTTGNEMAEQQSNATQHGHRIRLPAAGTLIAIATLAAITTGLLIVGLKARAQLRLIESLENAGVFVWVEPPGPDWLEEKLPLDWKRGLGRVYQVVIDTPDFAEYELKLLTGLTSIEELHLVGSRFGDAGMKAVSSLANLQV